MNLIQIFTNLILMEVGIRKKDIKVEKDIGKIFRILQDIIRVMEMVEIVQVVGDMMIIIIEVDIRGIINGMIMREEEIWDDLEQEDNNKIIIKINWDRDD